MYSLFINIFHSYNAWKNCTFSEVNEVNELFTECPNDDCIWAGPKRAYESHFSECCKKQNHQQNDWKKGK